jgi:type IV secretion system protein VirB11
VLGGETLLIAGGVGSGKTTLLSALLDDLLRALPNLRLVLCEEGCRELHAPGANVVRLVASEEAGVSLTRLLRCALRLNPDRIIVGEARGPEALDFLRACNTGHPGGMLTLHANSAADALYRLDDLVQEAGVPSQLGRIARAVDLVVYLERQGTQRRVLEVAEVRMHSDGGIAAEPVAGRLGRVTRDP